MNNIEVIVGWEFGIGIEQGLRIACQYPIALYRRLNQLAIQLLERDGILVSCSCSYHLDPQQLLGAIQRSARHHDRFAQIVEVSGQAPDHPIHPAIPETRYLKAFFCRIVRD